LLRIHILQGIERYLTRDLCT